jgi:hypothetical protein
MFKAKNRSFLIFGALLIVAFVIGFSSDYTSSFLAASKAPPQRPPVASDKPALDKSNTISTNVPTKVVAGTNFPVVITIQNTGAKWTASGGYRLASQNPPNNNVWGVSSVGLLESEEILFRQKKEFSFTAIAPSQPGTYDFQWQMSKNGVFFGQKTINKRIKVTAATSTSPVATTTPPYIPPRPATTTPPSPYIPPSATTTPTQPTSTTTPSGTTTQGSF